MQDTVSFVTLNKDHKPVWEPGLKAEVVSRRQRKEQKKPERPEDAPVPCDLEATLILGPEQRSEWLDRAFKGIPRGTAKATSIFDIVSHPRFGSGMSRDIGRPMFKLVKESLVFFSEKQRVTLMKKCKFAEQFSSSSSQRRRQESEEERSRSPRRKRSRSRSRSRTQSRSRSRRSSHSWSPSRRRPRSRSRSPSAHKAETAEERQKREEEKERRTQVERKAIEERRKFLEQQQEEQRRKWEVARKAQEEREKQRKARVGNAFLMGDEDNEEDEQALAANLYQLKRQEQREKNLDMPLPYLPSGLDNERRAPSSTGSGTNLQAVDSMGGDSVLKGAFEILARGGGAYMRSRSPSRRRIRSRSRRQQRSARESGSLRSPTPDGHLRGQMRAARKAKMVAQLLGVHVKK